MHRPRLTRAALIVALAAVTSLAACSREVAAGLEEAEANRGVVALARSGIDAEKIADAQTEGRFRLVVGRDEATSAIAVLAGEEIPRLRPAAAKDAPFVASPEADRASRVAQTAQAIERSLASVDGVMDARVHLDVPQLDPLTTALAAGGDAKLAHATASVLVRHRGATPPIGVEEIKRLVAGAVSGLVPDAVAVVTVSVPLPTSSAERQLAWVGPIGVSRGSLPAFRALAAAALGGLFVLSALLVAVALRLRRARDGSAARDEAGAEPERAGRGASR
jgi:type III secretion protein J